MTADPFRKARALVGLDRLEEARDALVDGLQFEPNDKVCVQPRRMRGADSSGAEYFPGGAGWQAEGGRSLVPAQKRPNSDTCQMLALQLGAIFVSRMLVSCNNATGVTRY